MAFCTTCGKPAPCGMNHKKGKPTVRSRQFAASRSSGPSRIPPPKVLKQRTEWVMHGPNQAVKRFSGHITMSKAISVKANSDSKYFAFRLSEHVKNLSGLGLMIHAVTIRFCTDVADGTCGIIKGWDVSNPTPPSALNRRRFSLGLTSGIQLLAPTDTALDSIGDDVWFVMSFTKPVKSGDIIWTRDSYVQHSALPSVTIPDDVLMSETLPPKEDSRG